MFPPFSPNDKDEVVVHLNRKEAVSLSLQMEDTARVILNKACKHFKLDPSRHDLCELDSAGGEWEWINGGWVRGGRTGLGRYKYVEEALDRPYIYIFSSLWCSEGCDEAANGVCAHKNVS